MKVKVTVMTSMQYVAVVDAVDETTAVAEAMLDALLLDSYDYSGQTASWEVMEDSTPVTLDKVKAQRIEAIKHRVGELQMIDKILEQDE